MLFCIFFDMVLFKVLKKFTITVHDLQTEQQEGEVGKAGLLKSFFLFPPQKRVQERGAGVARERHTGTTLLIHAGWGACCQSELRLREHGGRGQRASVYVQRTAV